MISFHSAPVHPPAMPGLRTRLNAVAQTNNHFYRVSCVHAAVYCRRRTACQKVPVRTGTPMPHPVPASSQNQFRTPPAPWSSGRSAQGRPGPQWIWTRRAGSPPQMERARRNSAKMMTTHVSAGPCGGRRGRGMPEIWHPVAWPCGPPPAATQALSCQRLHRPHKLSAPRLQARASRRCPGGACSSPGF